jgi:hypothetical protein
MSRVSLSPSRPFIGSSILIGPINVRYGSRTCRYMVVALCKTPHEAMRITLPGNIFVVGTTYDEPAPRAVAPPTDPSERGAAPTGGCGSVAGWLATVKGSGLPRSRPTFSTAISVGRNPLDFYHDSSVNQGPL